MQNLALIIDDEPDILELLEMTLKRMSVTTHRAQNLQSARKLLSKNNYDLCLTDMKLPDGDGLDFVNELQRSQPNLPIAVITAHGSIDSAILALKYGAFDFLTKPVDLNLLRNMVKNALNQLEQKKEPDSILIGKSPVILELHKTINKLSRSQAPIYISGESGTGKELVARLIHTLGARSDHAFIPVNCGAIPPDLIESEFFGHQKGSFTGAISDKNGLFQAAEGGTLFLDEVADLPQNIQVKLLRAIQERHVRPVGLQHELPVNVRILSATHKNLAALVENGNFRKDLFYRVNVIEVNIPPLRQRREDIPLLVESILKKLTPNTDTGHVNLSNKAMQHLLKYDFPGNIRELENILERAITMREGQTIEVGDIALDHNALINELPERQELHEDSFELESYLANVEKQVITEALNKAKWNKTKAAKSLRISFRALRYKLKKLGLDE